jgi:iron complex outermembrane receptor protein
VGPVPRIPPLRLRGGIEAEIGGFHLRGEVEWNDAQERVAAFENSVDGFTLVNLSAVWHPMGDEGPVTLMLAANNLFNVSARRAASFTRDFVPLAGRDIRISAKLSF